MKALNVANYIVKYWGDRVFLTNLKLNKLVYYCQVESLRKSGCPLFEDDIEAWQFGPVERAVYGAFARFGRARITAWGDPAELDPASGRVVDSVMTRLGALSACDLVTLSHKPDGAWASVYSSEKDNVITADAILASADGLYDESFVTFGQAIESAVSSMPNALKLLENS